MASRERSLAHELAEATYIYVSRCCDRVLGEGPFHEGNQKEKADWVEKGLEGRKKGRAIKGLS